jgi:predicted branched-subunit amino acid permease
MVSNSKGWQLVLDPDILGLAAACLVGTIVMALGFWQGADSFTVAIRTGITFAVTYVATFLLVRFVLLTILTEMVEHKKRAEEEQRAQERGAGAASEQGRPG